MSETTPPPAFSPLAWFASLSPEAKIALFRQLLAETERMDPGASERMEIWKRGKTARMTVDLPLANGGPVRGVGIHISVEDGDRMLWRTVLSRAERGDLDFQPGWSTGPGGDTIPGWIAPLGIGSLFVQANQGELHFLATKRKMVPIPDGMRPGTPIPIGLPPGEGFTILLFEGQLTIVGNFSALRPSEIRAARSAPVRIGMAKATDGLMVLGMHVRGLTDGWADLPFSLAIEPVDRRRIIPPEIGGSRTLLLVLADRATGNVAVMRPLMMSSKWSAEFERILEFQEDISGSYDRADYLRDIEDSYRRWPSPNHLAKDFTAVELARDNPAR